MWTVKRWLGFWLSDIDGRLRPSTVVNYRSVVNGYLNGYLGGHRLNKLRTADVQRAFDRMSRRTVRGGRLVSPASLHRFRAVLRSALSAAQRKGMIGHNPAWRIRLPAGARALPVVWTEDRVRAWQESGIRPRVAVWDLPHLARFLEAVHQDPLFPLLWVAALRGPRRGELVGLRWEDIDLAGGVLRIREKVYDLGGREVFGPPKSPAGVRDLHLDEFTVRLLSELLAAQRRRFGRVDGTDRVFRHAGGRPVRADWLTRWFRRRVDALGLPPVRLHDLRHAAAGLAGAAGVDLKVIQHDLGHSSAVTTAEYEVVFRERAQAAVHATAVLLLSHAKVRLSLEAASQA